MKEESELTSPLDMCPLYGGELVEKEVEKLLKGGVNTAVVKVKAEICLQCGGRRFEWIRQKLAAENVAEFRLLGQTYQVA